MEQLSRELWERMLLAKPVRANSEYLNATSFDNENTAINVVKENLDIKANEIANLLNNPSASGKITFDCLNTSVQSTGYGVRVGQYSLTNGLTKSRMVLVKDPTQALGFRILSAFPIF